LKKISYNNYNIISKYGGTFVKEPTSGPKTLAVVRLCCALESWKRGHKYMNSYRKGLWFLFGGGSFTQVWLYFIATDRKEWEKIQKHHINSRHFKMLNFEIRLQILLL
jgi:hypothetical protein